jgi:uncharacterized protein YciI
VIFFERKSGTGRSLDLSQFFSQVHSLRQLKKESIFMWYVIHATDVENSLEARMQARPAHIERVRELIGQGRLLLAGPMPNIDAEDPGPAGFSGSTIIASFDSLADAQEWANTDPYVEAGVYDYVDVRPFIKALP